MGPSDGTHRPHLRLVTNLSAPRQAPSIVRRATTPLGARRVAASHRARCCFPYREVRRRRWWWRGRRGGGAGEELAEVLVVGVARGVLDHDPVEGRHRDVRLHHLEAQRVDRRRRAREQVLVAERNVVAGCSRYQSDIPMPSVPILRKLPPGPVLNVIEPTVRLPSGSRDPPISPRGRGAAPRRARRPWPRKRRLDRRILEAPHHARWRIGPGTPRRRGERAQPP